MWGHKKFFVGIHGLKKKKKIYYVHFSSLNGKFSTLGNQVEASDLTIIDNESSRNSYT